MALGDSLTAGLNLRLEQAYPALLQERLNAAGLDYEVVNAGYSGDTSAGGLNRVDWALAGNVRVLIVALGGNDALRGLPPEQLEWNLGQIIERAQARGAAVVLAGMEAPPNFGAAYAVSFHQVYPDLAKRYRVALVPFLLEGVAGVESLNQRDGIHPTADGARIVADNVWAVLKPIVESQGAVSMIELRDVSKTVTSGTQPLTILHPMNAVIAGGQFVAIVGPSGSGKSTLLGLIAGLDSPTSGSVLIDGVDITRLDEDALARLRGEKIGFVFQFFHLIPSLTAYENIAVPMEIAGAPNVRQRANALLEEVGLTDRGHHYPSQLSGGEQQRVALARALANAPSIVLADEPTGNLDSANGRHILELLRGIHKSRGTTLVLVTHDAELAAMADARMVLRDGHVVS